MGWTSGWSSRSEIIDYITRDQKSKPDENGRYATWEILKKTFRGNNLWTIIERKDFQGETLIEAAKFICLFMIQKFGADDWGYKDVTASMGPTYYNCPISWFDEVPEDGQYDTEWRKACREGAFKAKAITKLQDGEQVYLPYELKFTDGVTESAFTVLKDGRRTLFRRVKDGARVRLSKGQQANLKRPEAPAMPELEAAFSS